MEDFRKKILDWHEDEPTKHWYHHWAIAIAPVIVFAIGALFKLMHWPLASWLMGMALFLILFRSFVLFFSKKRAAHDWIYFIGRITLIAALAVNFAIFHLPKKILLIALTLFGISVLAFLLKKKTPADEAPESNDDDY
jgi:cbb3-type cytochrome oxidase subunit 3